MFNIANRKHFYWTRYWPVFSSFIQLSSSQPVFHIASCPSRPTAFVTGSPPVIGLRGPGEVSVAICSVPATSKFRCGHSLHLLVNSAAYRLLSFIRSIGLWRCYINITITILYIEVEVNLRPTVSRPVCPGIRRPSGTCDQFFFRHEISCRRLWLWYFVAPSLTRGRVCNLLYNCFWALPEQSLLSRSPAELTVHILLYHLRLPQPGGPGSRIYIPPRNRMALLYPRALGSLSVASYDSQGLRWRYSNPPPHGVWPILDIIHRPVFYLKLNATLYVCPYLTENTLRIHYEFSRLMVSIGLKLLYANITVTVLDIIHHPVFYLKQDVSETGFCLHLQVDRSQLGSETEVSTIYWSQLSRFHLKTETKSSLRNVVF
jgi:hypothetical protein